MSFSGGDHSLPAAFSDQYVVNNPYRVLLVLWTRLPFR